MNNSPDTPANVIVSLSDDEAIVLFELLARWIDGKESATPHSTCFESASECAVLHGLLCDLETQLASPFRQEYGQMLGDARERLAHRWDGTNLRG